MWPQDWIFSKGVRTSMSWLKSDLPCFIWILICERLLLVNSNTTFQLIFLFPCFAASTSMYVTSKTSTQALADRFQSTSSTLYGITVSEGSVLLSHDKSWDLKCTDSNLSKSNLLISKFNALTVYLNIHCRLPEFDLIRARIKKRFYEAPQGRGRPAHGKILSQNHFHCPEKKN